MKKTETVFVCQECGHKSGKWLGKCPECGEWNSLVEESIASLLPLVDATQYDPAGGAEAWRSEHETLMYALAGAYTLYGGRGFACRQPFHLSQKHDHAKGRLKLRKRPRQAPRSQELP